MLAADSRRLLHGRRARKDKDGYFWIMGRVDDVLKISGHHWSTMEVESALVAHEAVAEAAVVGCLTRRSSPREHPQCHCFDLTPSNAGLFFKRSRNSLS